MSRYPRHPWRGDILWKQHLSEEAAARFLGITRQVLGNRRRNGTGPQWHKHRGRISYDVEALKTYMEGQS